jgi:hypothetical protein
MLSSIPILKRKKYGVKISDEKIAIVSLVGLSFWIFVVLPLIYLHSPSGIFWGLDSTAWTAIGAIANVVYSCLTAGLLAFAVYQVLSAREDAKINRTLAACDRYDTDPVLDAVARRLADSYDDGSIAANPKEHRVDLYSIFNYFESIAIGVSRGQYDEDIVKDQLSPIIIDHVDGYILSGITGWARGPVSGDEEEYFNHTMRLYRKWKTV